MTTIFGPTFMLLLLPATLWSAPADTTDFSSPAVDPTPSTTEPYFDTTAYPDEDSALTTFAAYDDDSNGTLKTELVFDKISELEELHEIAYAVTYKMAAVAKKLWRFVLDVLWKPLLKLYISPLRLVHTYLLPELISAECLDVYHGDVHRYENPLKPYRPNKLELVKCIFQYLGHYVRSWQFVNRIETNNYNLV